MKKNLGNGSLKVISDEGTKFINSASAMMMAHMIQWYYADLGFLTSNTINLSHRKVEVNVHIDHYHISPLPNGYNYTQREITSHPYYGYGAKPEERCRVITYFFKY